MKIYWNGVVISYLTVQGNWQIENIEKDEESMSTISKLIPSEPKMSSAQVCEIQQWYLYIQFTTSKITNEVGIM